MSLSTPLPLPDTDWDDPHDAPLSPIEGRAAEAPDTSAPSPKATKPKPVRESAPRPRAPRPAAGTVNLTGRTVQTILAKVDQLRQATEQQRSILAAALGCKSTPEDLTATIVSSRHVRLVGVDELAQIASTAGSSSDPFEVLAVAMQHESKVKQMWGVLQALGIVTGQRPARDSEASVQIARASQSFTAEHRTAIEHIRTLAKKGV